MYFVDSGYMYTGSMVNGECRAMARGVLRKNDDNTDYYYYIYYYYDDD